jgi:hypothetical protein
MIDHILGPSAEMFESGIAKTSQGFVPGSRLNLSLSYCYNSFLSLARSEARAGGSKWVPASFLAHSLIDFSTHTKGLLS